MNKSVFSFMELEEKEITNQKIKIFERLIEEFKETFSYDIKPSKKNYMLQAILEDCEKELSKINVR